MINIQTDNREMKRGWHNKLLKCAAYLLLKMALVRYIFLPYQSPLSKLEKIYLKVQKHKHKQKWKNNEHKDKTQNLSRPKGAQ